MTNPETPGNHEETLSDTQAEALNRLADGLELLIKGTEGRLDHLDTVAHDIQATVNLLQTELEEFRPLLTRYKALLDTSDTVRRWLPGAHRKDGK